MRKLARLCFSRSTELMRTKERENTSTNSRNASRHRPVSPRRDSQEPSMASTNSTAGGKVERKRAIPVRAESI